MNLKKFRKNKKIKTPYFFKHVEECSSTQDEALSSLLETKIPSLVLSDYQTQGRGRQGRLWESLKKQNLLFSAAFPLDFIPRPLTLIPLVAGHCLRRTLLHSDKKLQNLSLKWPNDLGVFQDSKFIKTAGILVEVKKKSLVIGWGLNLNSKPEIQNTTSLKDLGANLDFLDPESFVHEVFSYLCLVLEASKKDTSFGDSFLEYLQNEDFKCFWKQKIYSKWARGVPLSLLSDASILLKTEDNRLLEIKEI